MYIIRMEILSAFVDQMRKWTPSIRATLAVEKSSPSFTPDTLIWSAADGAAAYSIVEHAKS